MAGMFPVFPGDNIASELLGGGRAQAAGDEPRGPELDSYEERYRLTGRATAGVAASVVVIVLGFLWLSPVIFLPIVVILVILAVFIARGAGVIDFARRTVALRVDHE